MKEANDTFDLEAVYDEQIAPLMTQIIAICKTHKMPMLATFQYAGRGLDGCDFCTTCLTFPDERGDSPEVVDAARVVRAAERAPLHLRLIGADGQTKQIETIVG